MQSDVTGYAPDSGCVIESFPARPRHVVSAWFRVLVFPLLVLGRLVVFAMIAGLTSAFRWDSGLSMQILRSISGKGAAVRSRCKGTQTRCKGTDPLRSKGATDQPVMKGSRLDRNGTARA